MKQKNNQLKISPQSRNKHTRKSEQWNSEASPFLKSVDDTELHTGTIKQNN